MTFQIPPSLRPALQIFIAELQTHVEFFESSLPNLSQLLKVPDSRAELQHRFHTIKGAASFFNLPGIQQPAGVAERFLQKDFDESKLAEAEQVVAASMSALIAELPQLIAAAATL